MAIKAIRYTAMLDYCDGPLLFEALDATGGQYLAMLVETDDKRDMYAVIDLAPERLRQFRTGSVDLRTVLVEAGAMVSDRNDGPRRAIEPRSAVERFGRQRVSAQRRVLPSRE